MATLLVNPASTGMGLIFPDSSSGLFDMSRICFGKLKPILVAASASLALAACGGDEPEQPKAAAPVERTIYTSALDCEAGGKLTLEQCTAAIERAVALHDKYAAKYRSLSTCEEAQGVEKCERVDEKEFRPRLTAFIVSAQDPNTTKPLYLTMDGQEGFQTVEKEMILAKNDNYIFSRSARDAYELHASQGRR
jgi:hypothetical protein